MKKNEMKIVIDFTPEAEEIDKDGLSIGNEQEILDMLGEGISSMKTAKALIVSQERKQAARMIENKLALLAGVQAFVSKVAHKAKITVNGKSIPAYVGRISRENEGMATETSYVASIGEKGVSRAIQYVEVVVPGHIRNRLEIIHANGYDVNIVIDNLKAIIDDMVSEITKP